MYTPSNPRTYLIHTIIVNTEVKGSCKEGTILKIIEFIIESHSIWENGGKGDKKFTQKKTDVKLKCTMDQ